VLVGGPFIALAISSPALEIVSISIKLHHRRRRTATFRFGIAGFLIRLERPRTLKHPDMILRVDGHTRDLSKSHLRWQLWPERIDLPGRNALGERLLIEDVFQI